MAEQLTLEELQELVGNLAHGMALLSESFGDYAKTIHECMTENNKLIVAQFENIETKTQEIDQKIIKLNDKIDTAGSLLELTLCGPQKLNNLR